MAKEISQIDWESYTDFFGRSGVEIPVLLNGLLDADVNRQLASLNELFGRINHQASTNSLTEVTIPFLEPLLRSDVFVHHGRLLSSLRCVAIGLDSDLLVDLFPGIEPNRTQCYQQVGSWLSDISELVDVDDVVTRIEAMYTASWFGAKSLGPKIAGRLLETENCNEISTAILSLGVAEMVGSMPPFALTNVRNLLSAGNKLIRYSAAIYLDWHCQCEASIKLLTELSFDEEFDPFPVPFNNYAYWNEYAETRLAAKDGR